jgi:hypothetical protein
MPVLTRWFIKSSLVFFIAALVAGVAQASNRVMDLPPIIGFLSPVYIHLFLVGWVTQLIFGVVFWMFPKFSQQNPRRNERLGWATFALLNSGLFLRVVGEPLHAVYPTSGLGWVVALSALLQWMAGMGFIANTWGRVKEK